MEMASISQPSNGDYKKLSKRIREKRQSKSEIDPDDYQMLQDLRMTYKEPLSVIFPCINRLAHKSDRNSVCTYRIKRIESIISKLERKPTMQVNLMADIAGCRCIMTTMKDAMDLLERMKKYAAKPNHVFEIVKVDDYIKEPQDSGYKSIHVHIALKTMKKKVVEVQIRTLEQHNWATLVEISDLVYNSKLKEFGDKENPDLFSFHKLLSKDDKDLTLQDKKLISRISGQFRYLEKLGKTFAENSLELRTKRNNLAAGSGGSYYLISTDSDGHPEIFRFNDFCQAEEKYFEMFRDNSGNRNIVLTHFTNVSFAKISMAYSNYVMTYNATLLKVLRAIGEVASHEYNHYAFRSFEKNYTAFWRIIQIWLDAKSDEVMQFYRDQSLVRSKKKKQEWSVFLGLNILSVGQIIKDTQNGFNSGIIYYFAKRFKSKLDRRFSEIQWVFTGSVNYNHP